MANTRKLKVLVVEDDADVREIYEALLTGDGRFEVRSTHDGGHAAALLRAEPFDAALLDVKLPTMNGLQVAAVARSSQHNRRIPLLVVSGVLDDAGVERAKSFGVVKVLQKPVPKEQILAALVAALVPERKVAGYDVRLLNGVLKAATEVLGFYHGEAVVAGKPGVRKQPLPKRRGVTGLIGLTGETFAGSLAVVADGPFVTALARRIFAGAAVEMDQGMLVDVMGELCNQVCGRLKVVFTGLGIKSSVGLAEVVVGDDHVLVHKGGSPVLFVPLKVAGVACEVEFCLAAKAGFGVDESKGEESVGGVLLFE